MARRLPRGARTRVPADRFAPAVLALLLSACGGGSGEDTPPAPDQATVARVEADVATALTQTEYPTFATTETLEASRFGLIGDGQTVNTEVFRQLLSAGGRTIRIGPGDYVTGKFNIPANTILVLEPGTIIRDSGQLAANERLINITADNIHIAGVGARVLAARSSYTTGEQRHGVFIFGARNVVIDGLESSGHGGDGFYIGGPPSGPAADITLTGCRADNNRRQGLSITSARRVKVVDCEFMNTQGTAPEFGIDLEPNRSTDFLDEIYLLRPQTLNNRGGGVMIQLHKLDPTSTPINIVVIDHVSVGESLPLRTGSTEGVPGTIRYGRG